MKAPLFAGVFIWGCVHEPAVHLHPPLDQGTRPAPHVEQIDGGKE